MSLYERILGHPFVYNQLRPLAVGGIDMSSFYRLAGVGAGHVVLDVGCGTGDALRYLTAFEHYLGIDTNERAIRFARDRYGRAANVRFECKRCTGREVEELQPTHVILFGLLHHLADAEAIELLKLAGRSKRLERVATVDIVYLPRKPVNNLFARFDRGRYCRRPGEYTALAQRTGLRLVDSSLVRSHPTRGIVTYFTMTLEP
jgi:SAM-dependent methyltransferase